MKKGTSAYWGFKHIPSERPKILQKAGFDNVIINADPKHDKQNGKFTKQVFDNAHKMEQ